MLSHPPHSSMIPERTLRVVNRNLRLDLLVPWGTEGTSEDSDLIDHIGFHAVRIGGIWGARELIQGAAGDLGVKVSRLVAWAPSGRWWCLWVGAGLFLLLPTPPPPLLSFQASRFEICLWNW